MEKSNYNRGGGGGRGRGCGSGGVRCGNKQYHQSQFQTSGGARNSCGGVGNNCQPHNQGQYQSCGYGRRGGRGGDRSGTQMRTNSPPAQPWGDRPVHGGQGGTQIGTNPPPAQPWGYRSVQGGQGGIQSPQSAMGQGAGATGGRRSWSGSPRHVGGRGSWASAEGGGAGAGQTRRRILYLFMFLFLFLVLITEFYQTLPKLIVFAAENGRHTRLFLKNKGRDVHHNLSPGTVLDTKIVHLFEYDFCRYENLGTSKPTHYYVYYDEHNFTSDQLQKFIYQLCFTFARCTKPVSLVPPVCYNARVAYWGWMEMQFTPSASSSTSFTSSSSSYAASFDDKFYKLYSEFQNIMFFI